MAQKLRRNTLGLIYPKRLPFSSALTALACGLACGMNAITAEAEEKSPGFEVYGFAQSDYVQDFRRVAPAWEDTLRPTRIPTVAGQYGANGQATISVRQSRFGAQSTLPVEGSDLYTKFEFDMFGVGADEGKTTIRLRHAYGQWRQILAGQTHSLFMDIDMFPNIIDYWGPPGMVFLRNPQIRWTPITGENSVAVAIERPFSDIDPGQIREIDPDLGGNIQAHQILPDLTAQFRINRNWGHLQVAGILRDVGYDTVTTPNNEPSKMLVGWGFDVSSNIKLLEKDKLMLSAVWGRGIASYMNDGGTDLAPQGAAGALDPSTVPLFGVVGYWDHYWNSKWSTSFGYSRTQVDNRSFQTPGAFKRGQYASANLLVTPAKNMLAGLEFLWGDRTDKNGGNGHDLRTQISFKYSFSTKDHKS